MLIRSRKHFVAGIVMVGSFFAVCIYLLFPMLHDNYGNRLTGLQFADSVFNSLAKGSSYFLPEVRKEIDAVEGKTIEVNVPLEHKYSYGAARVLSIVGAEANYDKEGRLHFKGDLGSILNAAADVGDTLYYNEHKPIEEKYRMPALQVAKCWWSLLHPAIQELQKQGHIEYAKIVDVTLKKALEPGNNFYMIEITKVKEHIPLIVGMLVFYLLYTLWYGFGIFQLFEGIGLSMHK